MRIGKGGRLRYALAVIKQDAGIEPTGKTQRLPLPVRDALTELVTALQRVYRDRLYRIVLYGSMARGTGSVPDSDVDLLVVLDEEISPVEESWRLSDVTAAISLKYGLCFAPLFMSRQRYERGGSPLLLNVHKEGVVL